MKNASARGSINVKWGGYYIIAPENGNAGTVNIGDWDQLWQYGSGIDPVWDQDGVAPQCEVGNIGFGRRAFIPATYGNGAPIPKGYLESHSIYNYGWIFEIENPQTPGYVKPK